VALTVLFKKFSSTIITSLHQDFSFLFYFEDGLNISSPQPQPSTIENRTIQSYVKAYVEQFTGGDTVVCNLTVIWQVFVEIFKLVFNC